MINCDFTIREPAIKELEYRKLILESIESALKRGDEVFEKLISKETEDPKKAYDKFKISLKNIDHENLKK